MKERADTVELTRGVLEEALERDGIFASSTRGVSMKPMLHPRRDVVYITKCERAPKKYDCIVYPAADTYILHRIVGEREEEYLVRGDNTYRTEHVPKSLPIGILTEFDRRGKHYTTASFVYRVYSRVWVALYPLRYPLAKAYFLLKQLLH